MLVLGWTCLYFALVVWFYGVCRFCKLGFALTYWWLIVNLCLFYFGYFVWVFILWVFLFVVYDLRGFVCGLYWFVWYLFWDGILVGLLVVMRILVRLLAFCVGDIWIYGLFVRLLICSLRIVAVRLCFILVVIWEFGCFVYMYSLFWWFVWVWWFILYFVC